MDSPEQRRKRKRFLKPTKLRHSPAVRSLLYFLCFFLLFYFIFHRHTTSFHHAVKLSKLPTYPLDSLRVLSKFHQLTHFKLQSRVSFPDHVLLIINSNNPIAANTFECLYKTNRTDHRLPVLSVDQYTDHRFLVRCPQPSNNSSLVTLTRRGLSSPVEDNNNKPSNSWDNLAYEAVLDGSTVIIFVKGISHRQGKESDPANFNCHFGLPDSEMNGKYILSSKAVTAAQEVVRCAVPRSIINHPDKARGVQVTVSFRAPRGNHPVSGENSVYTPEPEKNDGTGGGVRFAESSDKTKDRVDYLDREHEDDVSAEETGDNDISVREKELGVCGLSNHMTQKSPNLVDSICSRTTNGSEHRVCADRSIGSDIDLVLTPPPSGFNGLGEGLENTDWALDGLFQSNGPAPSTPEAQVQVVSDPSLDSDPFNLMELIEQQDMEEILPDLNNEPSMELVPTKTIDTKKKKKGLKSNKKGPPHSLKLKNIIWSSKSVSTPRLISRLNYEDSAEIEDEVIQNPIGINKSKEDLEWEVHKTIELGEILGFRITGHEKNIRAMIIEEQEQIGNQ